MCLYSIRSERQLCERLRYDMLFRFFGLAVDGPTFDLSGFAHNRDRLLQADMGRLLFEGVLRQAKSAQLISQEHFTVDGTLMEAWASLKSRGQVGSNGRRCLRIACPRCCDTEGHSTAVVLSIHVSPGAVPMSRRAPRVGAE